MTSFHIVTDSGACFSNSRLLQQYPVTVVPYKIAIGGQVYREGVDISPEDMMQLIKSQSKPPRLIAPTDEEYAEIYARLFRTYEGIISIHTSREMTGSWQAARHAAQRIGDSAQITVIDSRSICGGQGMLVRVGAQAALDGKPYVEAVQAVRDAVDRIYSTYYVETLDYLFQNKIVSEARAFLGAMLKVKPFISIENGKPIVTEKVRNRSQAIDRMVEFLIEFEDLEDAMIVQNRTHITDQSRQLQDRLSVEFPGRHFPYSMYSMALAVLLGGDATGVAVLENPMEITNYGS